MERGPAWAYPAPDLRNFDEFVICFEIRRLNDLRSSKFHQSRQVPAVTISHCDHSEATASTRFHLVLFFIWRLLSRNCESIALEETVTICCDKLKLFITVYFATVLDSTAVLTFGGVAKNSQKPYSGD